MEAITSRIPDQAVIPACGVLNDAETSWHTYHQGVPVKGDGETAVDAIDRLR